MIHITDELSLNEDELLWEFVRASGPGGQKVNKTATAVQLSFDILQSPSLPDDVQQRLVRLAGSKVNASGILRINARRYRSQERNRQDALDRLIRMLQDAALAPKKRRPTRPTRAAKKKRLNAKRKISKKKRMRKPVTSDDDL
jgi:ribosome-associated protein